MKVTVHSNSSYSFKNLWLIQDDSLYIQIISFLVPALIAGVVVSLLVVLLLLSLVGGVLAVVVKARRKKRAKQTVQSESKVENKLHERGGTTDNIDICQSIDPTSKHNETTYDYVSAENIFINPASATASFNTPVYDSANYSEVVERPIDAGGKGHYEDMRVEETWGGGGCYEDDMKSVVGEQMKYTLKKESPKVMNPEYLYAQPDKGKKKWNTQEDSQVNGTEEEVATSPDDLYAKPDMTKKKGKRSQQHLEQEDEEETLAPTAPLPYKKHMKFKQEIDEDEEDTHNELPPFPVHDEEQYYNYTRSGPPTQDSKYDYAVVDRQH